MRGIRCKGVKWTTSKGRRVAQAGSHQNVVVYRRLGREQNCAIQFGMVRSAMTARRIPTHSRVGRHQRRRPDRRCGATTLQASGPEGLGDDPTGFRDNLLAGWKRLGGLRVEDRGEDRGSLWRHYDRDIIAASAFS